MTYLFKLAQRLAKIRFPFAVGVLGALGCGKGEKTEFLAPNPGQNTSVLNSIRVEPQITSVRVGGELQLTATGYTAAGAVIPVAVDWSGTGGIVTPDGRYTGVVTGSFVVRATARQRASVTDSARVGVWDNTTDLVALVVSPDSAAIEVGDTLDFTAALQMAGGALTGSANVAWSSTGGEISPAGRFTAALPGGYEVSAVSVNNLRGSARVLVREHVPTVTGIRLTPSAATVSSGGSAQFAATAEYEDGTVGSADVQWQATGGTISNGWYTATTVGGSYLVIARDRNGLLADTAIVTVSTATLSRLVVSPTAPVLAPGAVQQFTAQAQMSDNSWQVVPLVWSATAGVITPGGVYTAGLTEGVFSVIAASPGSSVAGTAVVTVVGPAAELTKVDLNPSSAIVPVGANRQFTASGTWTNGGNSTPVVTWAASGGTITPSGLFTAGSTLGAFSVSATASNGRADTSSIQVTGAVLSSLQLSPASVSRQPGESQQFTVSGTWSNGSSSPPAATYTSSGGTITAGGLYVAGATAGTYAVIATQQGGTLADTSLVTISTLPPTLVGVVLTPTSAVLAPAGIQQFTAFGLYSNGTLGSISITWSGTGGSINSAGRYTAASTPGTYRVIAQQSGNTLADTSVVTITSAPVVTSVVVSPKPTSLQVNTTRQFSASATWSNGSTTVPPISWTATGGSINASGLYTAGNAAGTFRVVATHQGGTKADTSVVTLTVAPVPPPTLIGLVVAPKPTSVSVNTTRQFNVGALWSDGSATVPAITWAATGGTISSSGLFTAGSTPGTFQAIATGGGKADTAVVTVTGASTPVLTSFVMTPGTASVAAGGTVQFQSMATWSDGLFHGGIVSHSATGGTITAGGLYSAGSLAGTFAVIAICSCGAADTSVVFVTAATAPVVTSFVMTPASVTLPVGGLQQFSAAAAWSDGVSHPTTVSYSATGGTVSAAGLFVAGSVAGSFAVIASCSCGAADTSSLFVTAAGPATLTSLQLSPASFNIAPGGTQQLSLSYTWSNGSSTPPPVDYSATGGTVSGSGFYTAPSTSGNYQIVVSHTGGTIKDTSFVSVAAPVVPSGLYPNRPVNFTVVVTDYAMNTTPPGTGGDRSMGDGSGWGIVGSNVTRVTDATDPVSPSNVMEWTYLQGQGTPQSSFSPGKLYHSLDSSVTEWYIAFPVWHDANFEWNPISNKLMFLLKSGASLVFQSRYNSTYWNMIEESSVVGVYNPNVAAGGNPTGQWRKVEVLYKLGAGGHYKCYIDGVLVSNFTNTNFPTGMDTIMLDGTWGGGSGPTTRTSFRRIGHVFIAHP